MILDGYGRRWRDPALGPYPATIVEHIEQLASAGAAKRIRLRPDLFRRLLMETLPTAWRNNPDAARFHGERMVVVAGVEVTERRVRYLGRITNLENAGA